MAREVSAYRKTEVERVSRRVGELVSKRAGADGAPLAMNDLAHWPRFFYAYGVDATGYPRLLVTHHCAPLADLSRSRGLAEALFNERFGISLPCQVVPADLRLAFTVVYRS